MKYLLVLGGDVTEQDELGNTWLHAVVSRGDVEITKIVLSVAGVDVNIKNRFSETPLHLAAKVRDTGGLKLLLDAGAKLNVRDTLGSAPLSIAVAHDNVEVAQLLLGAGASPSVRNTECDSLLHIVLCNNSRNMIYLLLNNGADPKVENWCGETPLEIAQRNMPEVVKLLERYSS